jgi:hypothetical protein
MQRYDPSRIKATWHDSMTGIEETFERFGVAQWQVRPLRAPKGSPWNLTEDERRVTVTFLLDGRAIELSLAEHREPRHNLWIIWQAIEAMRLNRVRGLEKVMGAAYLALEAPRFTAETDPWAWMALPRDVDPGALNARYRELARRFANDEDMLRTLNICRDRIAEALTRNGAKVSSP